MMESLTLRKKNGMHLRKRLCKINLICNTGTLFKENKRCINQLILTCLQLHQMTLAQMKRQNNTNILLWFNNEIKHFLHKRNHLHKQEKLQNGTLQHEATCL